MGLTFLRCQCIPVPGITGLDDIFVGTFHHARANRPAVTPKLLVLHQCLSFAEVVQMLMDPFSLCQIVGYPVSHTQQRSGADARLRI